MAASIFAPLTPSPSIHVHTPEPIPTPTAQGPMVSFPSVLQLPSPQSGPCRDTGRVLILCFDSTGNKFGEVGVKIYFQLPAMSNLFAEST
jgi:hypothetical protein